MDRTYLLGRKQRSISESLTSPSRSARAAHRAFAKAYGKLLSVGIFPSRLANIPLPPWRVSVASNNEEDGDAVTDTVGETLRGLARVLTADCLTRGKVALHIRTATPADESALIAMFDAVDEDDLRFRFGGTTQTVGSDLVAPLLQSDRTVGVTFLAFIADGALVAAATLADIPGGDKAEVALSVHACWKGKGVAWALLDHTLSYATVHGLKQVTSFESGEDRLAINLEREMGFVARLVSASPVELSLTKNVAAE